MGMHFFTAGGGGNPMMYVNLIWAWGHPEVYILILPAFGVYLGGGGDLFAQTIVWLHLDGLGAIWAISFLSFTVWLHHFFTMGAGADVNAFFGIMTTDDCHPNGGQNIQLAGHHVPRADPVRHADAVVHGLRGDLHDRRRGRRADGRAASDYQLHNSLFLVAHFHTMIVGGVLFGYFAGITYWFPKVFGFPAQRAPRSIRLLVLADRLSCWRSCPLYILGLEGATRRLDHYSAGMGWQPLFIVAGIGGTLIACGIATQILQLIVSIKQRQANRVGDDPGMAERWSGQWRLRRQLITSQFCRTIDSRDAFWTMKKAKAKAARQAFAEPETEVPSYRAFDMPKNTAMGMVIAGAALVLGFAACLAHWLVGGAGSAGRDSGGHCPNYQ